MEEENKSPKYGKRPLWQWLILYAVIALVVYGAVYYFILSKNKGYNNNQNKTQYQQSSQSPASSPASNQAESQKFTIEGSEFAFTPSAITVKNGQPVQITFKNTGQYSHNLTIADLNIATKTIGPGEEDTVTFTPNKTGQVSFMCTVPTHADKGMKGTLNVQ